MNIKFLTVGLSLLCSSVVVNCQVQCSQASFADVYTLMDQEGPFTHMECYSSDLGNEGLNNAIQSTYLTGMWMFYTNTEYNSNTGGYVYWIHGIQYSADLDELSGGRSSSMKFAGNRHALNEESFTLYSGEAFTGDEFYATMDAVNLAALDGDTSSLVLTGQSPWTFYTGPSYTGFGYCFLPDTHLDTNPGPGPDIQYGIFSSMTSVGVPNNAFYSAKKGCFTQNIIPSAEVEGNLHKSNWGFARVDKNGRIIEEDEK